MKLHIVLVEPEIPQNTGNIARTCVAVGATLHLVKPLGFSIEEKEVRRAGLDYWQDLDLRVHKNLEAFFKSEPGPFFLSTTKAEQDISRMQFQKCSYLLFGRESAGLPEELLVRYRKNCFRIPMQAGVRSLNLSNAAAVAAYEVLRQHNYDSLETGGTLHRLEWI
ncbi:MAG: tRNA (cytidine(34)-2'-O)-methyltransferase [Spirochaetales bacterium]|nr:tRNA (cytidine(34)-2'-O)-methyltransferase [Spirochaetales bacterium]